jgi:hypothetical protein
MAPGVSFSERSDVLLPAFLEVALALALAVAVA